MQAAHRSIPSSVVLTPPLSIHPKYVYTYSPGKVLAGALRALEDGAKQEGRGGQQRRRLRQGL
jgi:hypothetical protein